MRIVFDLALIWLVYVYAGYPIALAITALWWRVRPRSPNREILPSVSVLIAARNEEKDIRWKISETLAWDYPPDKLKLLIASDASDDGTDEIVRRLAGPRLTFIRMERRSGKVRALNRLA